MLPPAVVERMKQDEERHAEEAAYRGPCPAQKRFQGLMRFAAKVRPPKRTASEGPPRLPPSCCDLQAGLPGQNQW